MVRPIAFQPVSIRGRPEGTAPPPPVKTGTFPAVLQTALEQPGVRMSAHAAQRLERRNIALSPDQWARVGQAVDQLAGKGARESLLLIDDTALVVSIPNRTVITAVPTSEMENTVFTQIDSAVVLRRPEVPSAPVPESRPVPERGGLRAAERLMRRL